MRQRAREVFMLICRRCESEFLLELVRLDGSDHTVYRCRSCGFLFSPPDAASGVPGTAVSPLLPDGGAARSRREWVAAIRPRRDRR